MVQKYKAFSHHSWRRSGLGIALALIALATGCARSVVNTEIKPDGTWKRTVKFHASAPDMGGMNGAGGFLPKLEEVFVLPKGPGWTTKQAKEKDEIVYTAVRDLKAGETVEQDVAVKGGDKGGKGKALVNAVSVRQVAPGRYEYRETLHWLGPHPKELDNPDPQMIAAVKNALPPNLATPENVRAASLTMNHEFWHVMLGPGDPLIAQIMQLMMFPDLAERKLQRRIGAAVNTALEKQFGAQMSPEARLGVMRKLVGAMISQTQEQSKSKAKPEGPPQSSPFGDSGAGLTALTFIVKLPGKIVETNGEADPLTNEVYWTLYSEAAALGDVTLTATCEVR